jgi:UDP-N-acetylmuramoyl-tripeptide--D-alanyl-D-alanine ligase
MTQMTLGQAARWMAGAAVQGDPLTPIMRVHTDTRTLAPGDLFVALKGGNFNGNDFLPQARSQGAVAAVCEDVQALQQSGLSGFVVADARRALGQLAAGWRSQFELPLIAVTGSNGKTTVTQMVASILRTSLPVNYLATQGNFNNDIGVPLTLLRLRADTKLAVLELGMNHPGEIAQLAALAQPTVALVNNAQREHMEFMHTIEAVAEENGAVISALGADGVAVFPGDDAYTDVWRSLAQGRACLSFSDAPHSRAEVSMVASHWHQGAWQLQANTPAGPLAYRLHIAGQHNLKNSLAAATCALAAGISLADIARGLAAFEPVKGRSRSLSLMFEGRALTLIDDSYNANPDSVQAAIEVLAGLPAPRLLVLGDMGEVGDQGLAFHAQAGELAKARGIEALYTLGDLSQATTLAFGTGQHFQDAQAMNAQVLQTAGDFASILVKGSRFMRMERVIQALQAETTQSTGAIHAA